MQTNRQILNRQTEKCPTDKQRNTKENLNRGCYCSCPPCLPLMSTHDHEEEIYVTLRQILRRQTDEYQTDKYPTDKEGITKEIINGGCYCSCPPCLPLISTHDHDDQHWREYMLLSEKYQTDKQTNTIQTDKKIQKKFSTMAATAPACHVFLSCQLIINFGGNIYFSSTNIKNANR